MEIEQKKYHSSNVVVLFLSGLFIVFLSVLVFLLILKSVYGRYTTANLLPDVSSLEDLLFGTNPEVALHISGYTKNMLPAGDNHLEENIKTWKKFLSNTNLRFEFISDEQIEKNEHTKYKILVLPGSLSLSDREIADIKKFLEAGGSVFATSGTATFSDNGKWRGWDFFSEVFGVKFAKQIGNEDRTKIHTLRGRLPLTANIPTGFPLNVATWDKPIAVEVLDPRTTQVSFWYNYRLEEGLVREGIKNSAGIIYGTYGKGRFVWLGFEINSILGLKEDYVYFEKLFNNSLHWLTYEPIAYLREWPNGYDAAAVIAPLVTDKPENIYNLLPSLFNEKIKATFLVEPKLPLNVPHLVKKLNEYGEVAPLVDLGYIENVDDKFNRLYNYEEQLTILNNAKVNLEKVTGKTVTGVYPYYGLFDENTIKALIHAKYNYVITDSLTDRSVPRTIKRGDNRITSITKTARDDYEIIRDFGLTDNIFQFYSYQEDLDRVKFEGGLYLLKLHTGFQLDIKNVKVVEDIIRELKQKNFWITTAAEVQSWYDKREYIELRSIRRGATRVVVTISNPGNLLVDDLVVDVDLNEKAKNISVESEIIGTKRALFSASESGRYVYLHIDDLEPGESRTYYIDYDKEVF